MSPTQPKVEVLRSQIQDLEEQIADLEDRIEDLEADENRALMLAARQRHNRLMRVDPEYRAKMGTLVNVEKEMFHSPAKTWTFTGLNTQISKAKLPKTRTKKSRGKK